MSCRRRARLCLCAIMQSWITVLLSHLLGLLPMLLVYVGGIVLCALWWRRAPRAALLASIGLNIELATSLGHTTLSSYLITTQSISSVVATLRPIRMAASVLHAIGFAFVVAAVFAGRSAAVLPSGFEVQRPSPPAPVGRGFGGVS